MPAIDYVSIVSSLYRDRLALTIGTLVSAGVAIVAGVESGAWIHYLFSGLFLLLAIYRYQQSIAFEAVKLELEDAQTAEYWEFQALLSGSMAAVIFGAWCFISVVFVKTEFSILLSLTTSIAAMVGLVARNYGLDRLITLQLLLVGTPICLGLVIDGNIYHMFLAAMFTPVFYSFRALASDVRNVLLSAVRDRVEVSRLAGELDTALSTMSHGLVMLDENLVVLVANVQMKEMLWGEQDYSCVGKSLSSFIELAISTGVLTQLSGQRLASALGNVGQSKLILQFLDGRHCEVSINRRESQTVLVFQDITERMQAESRIKFMARYDPDTNLPNRAYFSEQISAKIRNLNGEGVEKDLAFLSLDIDDFKYINDTFGHPTGDRVLALVARRMRQALDSNVLVGRFGGDEFAAFFEHDVNQEELVRKIEGLFVSLSEPFELDGQGFSIRASAGLVVSDCQNSSLEELLKRSDLALYSAKVNHKGSLSVFNDEMYEAYQDKMQLKDALRDALTQGNLMLFYQPVVDIKSGKVVGCEALARWHHEELGIIPPYIFIPIAEEMGVISEITEWALNTATKECATWPSGVGVAVNISAWDFKGDNVQRMVYTALAESGLEAHRLEIEVTESVLVQELEVASTVLGEISCQGIGIALDDFGTGYSSLSYLHDLPFSKLKIDRSFTQNITTDPKVKKLMRNIATLGQDLNMMVTVEGVETQDQYDVVAEMGLINYVQGYIFGTPVPQSEIANLIYTLSGRAETGSVAELISKSTA